MTTQAQILANRCNAKKSTGPKTTEGKSTVAKNATKHGLFARYDVVISENQREFDALREEMLKELAPEGVMEIMLAERIFSLTWRLKRTERMQNELIDVKIRREINSFRPELSESLITGKPCDQSKYSDKCYDDQVLGYIVMRDFAGYKSLDRLSLYERRFEASLFKTMAELKKLQYARKRDQSGTTKTQASSYRGRDVAQAIPGETRATECAKQSQSAGGEDNLTPFMKREYELLIGTPSMSNKANDSQPKAGFRDPKTGNRLRRQTGVCRY